MLTYNLLNYPNSSVDPRADTLKRIIDFYKPDLFLMQELRAEWGVGALLQTAFNTQITDAYASGTWAPMQSAPSNVFKLQQNVIYNEDKLTLLREWLLTTTIRDLNFFKFMVNDPNLEFHNDTTFIYAVSAHLKAGNTSQDRFLRQEMTQVMVAGMEDFEPYAGVLVGGDFNLYSSTEQAYQTLLNPLNPVQLKDPLSAPGEWSNNPAFAWLHTQSTRTTSLGDGATGGVDDRFDFILASANMFDADARIRYVSSSYEALGNNGTCFDQRIIDCVGGNTPQSIRWALWQMSDHLPVKMEVDAFLPQFVGIDQQTQHSLTITGENCVSQSLRLTTNAHLPPTPYTITDSFGKVLQRGITQGGELLHIEVAALPQGIHLLHLENTSLRPYRFLKINE